MKPVYYVMWWLIILMLAGCQGETFTKVPKDGSVLISADILDHRLTFTNTENGENTAVWELEEPFTGALLLPDHNTLIIYGPKMEEVLVYNMQKGTPSGKWDTGKGIVNAKLSRDGAHVLFADQNHDTLRFYSLAGHEEGEIKTGKSPLTILPHKEENIVYVVNFHEPTVSVVDTNLMKVTREIEVEPASTGGVLIEELDELWLGGHGEGTELQQSVAVYNAGSGEKTAEVKAPVMPVDLTRHNGHLYVLSHGSNELRKIDPDSKKIIDTTVIGANPFEIISAEERLYLASYDSGEVFSVDPDTLEIIDQYKVGRGPFQLIYRGANR